MYQSLHEKDKECEKNDYEDTLQMFNGYSFFFFFGLIFYLRRLAKAGFLKQLLTLFLVLISSAGNLRDRNSGNENPGVLPKEECVPQKPTGFHC